MAIHDATITETWKQLTWFKTCQGDLEQLQFKYIQTTVEDDIGHLSKEMWFSIMVYFDTTLCDKVCQVTCGKSVGFSGSSGFLHH